MLKTLQYVLILLTFGACKSVDLNSITSFSPQGHVHAVVEIPAGTNKKIEYNKTTKKFEVDQRNGKDRIIQFLPYPGNYGFIPSTFSDPTKGGDGDPLDVIVISEHVASGTLLEVIPLGMLKLIDDNELDYKLIAIPAEEKDRTISALYVC